MIFYDTHAHLDFPDFADDLREMIERASVAGISKLIAVGTDFGSSRRVLALARDYYDAGVEGALVVARVMRGENPASIPITNLKKAKLIVNLGQARKLGVNIPESVIRRADTVIK